jgi:Cu+-exporting ATPase
MPENDQFVMIRVEGMHCHRCQAAIKRDLQLIPGVHEVEVDFPSGQASVLFDPSQVKVRELMDAINECGYSATSFIQRPIDPAAHS